MSQIVAIKVPDIGDFKDVDIIDVMIAVGDSIEAEQSLITLEADKATMDVPAPAAGVVKELKVKVGDKVSEGSVILMLESVDASAEKAPAPTPVAAPTPSPLTGEGRGEGGGVPRQPVGANNYSPPPQTTPSPLRGEGASSASFPKGDIHAEVLVLGAGPGGYTAAFRAADLGKQVVLIEKHATLGGVCLNVGCIPSKALLHVAKVITEADEVGHHGVSFGKPEIDIDKIRSWKESVIGKLTGGLAGLAKQRKVQVVRGLAKFTSPHSLAVQTAEG